MMFKVNQYWTLIWILMVVLISVSDAIASDLIFRRHLSDEFIAEYREGTASIGKGEKLKMSYELVLKGPNLADAVPIWSKTIIIPADAKPLIPSFRVYDIWLTSNMATVLMTEHKKLIVKTIDISDRQQPKIKKSVDVLRQLSSVDQIVEEARLLMAGKDIYVWCVMKSGKRELWLVNDESVERMWSGHRSSSDAKAAPPSMPQNSPDSLKDHLQD